MEEAMEEATEEAMEEVMEKAYCARLSPIRKSVHLP